MPDSPFAIKPGQTRFIDTFRHPVRVAHLKGNNLIYEGNFHFGFDQNDIYSGIIEDTGKKIGEEKLLVRTVSLEEGNYAWVDIRIREALGSNKGYLPDPKGNTYPFVVRKTQDERTAGSANQEPKPADKTTGGVTQKVAKPGDVKTFTVKGVSFKMVRIPAGEFLMGSPSDEPERENNETQHRVRISKDFWISQTEVTQDLWKTVMGNNHSEVENFGDACPVGNVSWDDCQEFIRKLNGLVSGGSFRLPTEAEWEYSCRAGTTTPFNTGRCLNSDQANYDGNCPYSGCSKGEKRNRTVKVGSFAPNGWGLYDMHGNVWEWCQDWHGNYPSSSVTDPKGPSGGSARVGRGGSWSYNGAAGRCRSAHRDFGTPFRRGGSPGLRLAASN